MGLGAALEKWLILRAPDTALKIAKNIPQPLNELIRRRAFRQTLRIANEKSAFYRKRFAEFGIRPEAVSSPEQMGDFFTTDQDLLTHEPEEFLCAKPQLAFETSGTSGRHKRFFYRYDEIERNSVRATLIFRALGATEDDHMLSAFEFHFWFPGYFMPRIFPYTKALSCTVGKVDPVEVYERMEEYKFNVILANPTWVLRFTEIAEEAGKSYPMKFFIGGGEHLTASARKYIEGFWKCPFIVGYGNVGAGTYVGLECLERKGYHFNDQAFFIECINQDDEGDGEIVITTLNRDTMPLIRYRTGDVARILYDACPCGLPTPRVSRIVGRLDEMVSFAGGNVHPVAFADIFQGVVGMADDWQIAIKHKGVKEAMEIRIEMENAAVLRDEIQRKITANMEEKYIDMFSMYQKKLYDIDYTFLPKGTLRTGRKLRRVVDERDEIKTEMYQS